MNKEDKISTYEILLKQIAALVDNVEFGISSLANISSVLHTFDSFFWTGFYVVKDDDLFLGPFQGDVACIKIPKGRGVCGSSWQQNQTIIVDDVEKFPGHIACSSKSKSEIVVPVYNQLGKITAVLDIDSEQLANFDEVDKLYLEKIVKFLEKYDSFV